jgi:hypothetical protein
MAEAGSFEVNGKRYSVATDLTVGEMADAENYFGADFSDPKAARQIRTGAAMLYISIHREDPTVTVEDIRSLPSSVFESFLQVSDASPPAEEKSEHNGSSGRPSEATGDHQDDVLRATGLPGSDTGSDLDPLTSLT